MAIMSVIHISGDTDAIIAASKKLNEVVAPKAREKGGISHAMVRTDEGAMVVNLWESEEAAEAVTNDPEVVQARKEAVESGGASAPPRTERFEVVHYETVA